MSQNFNNHKRFSPLYHFLIAPTSVLGFSYFLYKSIIEPSSLHIVACILLLLQALASAEARMAALKVQDRSIMNEVRLRYLLLTGNSIPSELNRSQIIALRFASDEEIVELTEKSVAHQLSATDIKKAISNWKADHGRV